VAWLPPWEKIMHIFNHLSFSHGGSHATNALANLNPQAPYRSLIRPNHEPSSDHSIESRPEKVVHFIV
jgi:hypothetical protein